MPLHLSPEVVFYMHGRYLVLSRLFNVKDSVNNGINEVVEVVRVVKFIPSVEFV